MCSGISLVLRNPIFLFFLLAVSAENPPVQKAPQSGSKCSSPPGVGLILCAKKVYEPEDVISDATNKPIDLEFKSMIGPMHLSIPNTYFNTSHGKYQSFSVADSCVENIEEEFFKKLDKNSNKLKKIKFSKVTCLRSLRMTSFSGIEQSLEKLYFQSMPDLIVIEMGFFNVFNALKLFYIVNTGISSIPNDIFDVLPNITTLRIDNNKLKSLPRVPLKKLETLQADSNPFHCDCPMMDFIKMMRENINDVLKSENYR